MKKSLKNTVLLALTMSLSFCSKNDDDNTGNDSVTPVQNPALMKELTASPEGWKLTYVSPDDSFGGYNFLMKFDDQGKVTMLSDLSATATPTTSRYSTQEEGRGLVLSFIGNNQIHRLADALQGAASIAHTGKVYQFLYTGKEGNNLKFQNLLLGNNASVVFQPATAADWSRTPALYKNIAPLSNNASHYYLKVSPTTGTPTTYPIEFTNRVLSLKNTPSKIATSATENGIAFHRAFTLGGQPFNELKRVENSNPPTYRTTVNGVTAELFYSLLSPDDYNSDDYQHINTQIEALAINTQVMKKYEYLTEAFYQDVLRVDATTDLYMVMMTFSGTVCQIEIGHNFEENNLSFISVNAKYELKNKRLYFTETDGTLTVDNEDLWNDPKNKAVLEQAKRALNRIYELGNQGYYVKKLDLSIRPFATNPIYFFQSYEHPLYAFLAWGQ
ncbi:DUF4302 domain-containing protein [Capnocytophaga sputigena]|uniref:DUF4302 domain-containing protein n=1 Tax=Capnocytophaga sputigena TaxID=1019 RepID=A0AAX2IDJ8_CAPSP|nr:DUF4302 domain-containing protein [Capnocytophaga sputigena]ATA84147.1 hypothetical protein CGC55_06365 [Capnocytophaga sputigena]EEB64596.1 hypothetical protein CAPSP0001_2087 [Capnocytophaga sputigena ATCC 33612]SQA76105.1 Uncharacterised protein [Capnocytophaga sputigena]